MTFIIMITGKSTDDIWWWL